MKEIKQGKSTNRFTVNELVDLWNKIVIEFDDHWGLGCDYTFDEFCSYEDERLIAYLVYIGLEPVEKSV